jgi:Flp pilus assembly protein TadD
VSDAESRLQRARALMDLGRHEQAQPLLAEALAEDPASAGTWCAMARCCYAQRDWQGALDATGRALEARPGMVVAWRFRALALIELERWEDAWEAAGEAVRLEPMHWYGHLIVARVLLANTSGYFHENVAGQAAARARELAPHEPDTHFMVGSVAQRAGRAAEAEACYREALRLDPEHRSAQNQLALIQMQRGDTYAAAQGFAAVAAADQGGSGLGEHNLRVLAVRLIAPARWISLGVFFLVNIVVTASPGTGAAVRAACLAVTLASWGGWTLWAARQVPGRLRRPLLRSARSSRYVGFTLLAVGALTLAGLALLLVPQLDAHSTLVLVAGIAFQALALQAARKVSRRDRAALRG